MYHSKHSLVVALAPGMNGSADCLMFCGEDVMILHRHGETKFGQALFGIWSEVYITGKRSEKTMF